MVWDTLSCWRLNRSPRDKKPDLNDCRLNDRVSPLEHLEFVLRADKNGSRIGLNLCIGQSSDAFSHSSRSTSTGAATRRSRKMAGSGRALTSNTRWPVDRLDRWSC